MLCTIDEIKQIKASLLATDKLLSKREKLLTGLKNAENEKGRVLAKHGPALFALRATGFAVVWFVALELIYVVFPKDFPYYILAPVFGAATEYYFKRKYVKTEMKSLVKDLDARIKDYNADISEIDEKINELSLFAEDRLERTFGFDNDMVTNVLALDYVMRDDADDKKVSFLARHNEFINKYNCIGEDHAELKESIDAAQIQARYRELMIKDIRKGLNKVEENNDTGKDSKS